MNTTQRALLFTLLLGACTKDPVDVGPRGDLDAAAALSARRSCQFQAGALPGLTLARDAPLGGQIPIDTIVVLMFENRSFDHLLGALKAAGQPDADVAAPDASNPDAQGQPIARYRDPDLCFGDTNHEWDGSHTQYNGGKNDGFVVTNAKGAADGGRRAMSYYTEADLPGFYALAKRYAVADRYFASLLGPTFPNREYLYAATSFGRTGNDVFTTRQPTLMDALERAAVPWHIYYETIPGYGAFLQNLGDYFGARLGTTSEFFANAKAGTLESVVFLDPDLANEWGGGNDLHPPGDVQVADAYLAKVVEALTQSPQWPHLALIITFDEHGGLYDHVPPPSACPPDGLLPDTQDPPGARFDRYGFRVPTIVVSPYARPGYVSHAIYDHGSVVRFIQTRFKLPALTARDANADPLLDLFDFSRPALLTPPALPTITVDAQRLAACQARYPKKGS